MENIFTETFLRKQRDYMNDLKMNDEMFKLFQSFLYEPNISNRMRNENYDTSDFNSVYPECYSMQSQYKNESDIKFANRRNQARVEFLKKCADIQKIILNAPKTEHGTVLYHGVSTTNFNNIHNGFITATNDYILARKTSLRLIKQNNNNRYDSDYESDYEPTPIVVEIAIPKDTPIILADFYLDDLHNVVILPNLLNIERIDTGESTISLFATNTQTTPQFNLHRTEESKSRPLSSKERSGYNCDKNYEIISDKLGLVDPCAQDIYNISNKHPSISVVYLITDRFTKVLAKQLLSFNELKTLNLFVYPENVERGAIELFAGRNMYVSEPQDPRNYTSEFNSLKRVTETVSENGFTRARYNSEKTLEENAPSEWSDDDESLPIVNNGVGTKRRLNESDSDIDMDDLTREMSRELNVGNKRQRNNSLED